MRRFTSDVLRVLKGYNSKQLNVSEFCAAYAKVLNKPFNPAEYGLCSYEDLIDEVPENTVVVTGNSSDITIGVPKRERTAAEVKRTKQFSQEVSGGGAVGFRGWRNFVFLGD